MDSLVHFAQTGEHLHSILLAPLYSLAIALGIYWLVPDLLGRAARAFHSPLGVVCLVLYVMSGVVWAAHSREYQSAFQNSERAFLKSLVYHNEAAFLAGKFPPDYLDDFTPARTIASNPGANPVASSSNGNRRQMPSSGKSRQGKNVVMLAGESASPNDLWRDAKLIPAAIGGAVNKVVSARSWSPQIVLLLTFASFYFAIGPGNFFAVDEVGVEETAQAVILQHTLEIPTMGDARLGRGQSYYTMKGPGLPFASLPFVYAGLKLDDLFGSMNGGPLAGPPLGVEEHPLRWGGRLTIWASLIVDALAGGAIVAVLYLVGTQLSANRRAALLMALAAGLATLVMSEATHFFQHPMAALMLLASFWFFAGAKPEETDRRALYGGLSLGIAILARPNAAVAGAVLWAFGAIAAWRALADAPDRVTRLIRRAALASIGPVASVAG